jgi:hypothetical protein
LRTGGGINSYLLDADGAYITPEIREPANAAFIVRACNSHDDLLAACRLVKAFMDLEIADGDDGLWTDSYRELHESCCAAIAKAEGR